MPLLSRRPNPLADLLNRPAVLPDDRPRRQEMLPPLSFAPPPEPEVVPEPEVPFGPRDYAAMGVRGLSSLLGIGALPGAAFGAGGETIASLIEGDNLLDEDTLKEIAAAGVTGAAGGGVAKAIGMAAGPLQAALRGGLMSGAGTAASGYIREGELPEFGDIALSGVLGGGIAGGTSALLRKLGVNLPPGGAPKGPAKPTFDVEQTISPGKGVLPTGPRTKKLTGSGEPITARPPQGPSGQEYDAIYDRWRHLTDKELANTLTGDELTEAQRLNKIVRGLNFERPADRAATSRVPVMGDAPPPTPEPNLPELRHAAGAEDAAWKMIGKERDSAIAKAKMAAGMAGRVAAEPSVSQSFSTAVPGGTARMTQRFVRPEDEADEAAETLASMLGVGDNAPTMVDDVPDVIDDVADLGREAQSADDIAAQLGDEPIKMKERRAQPRTAAEEAYTQALRTNGGDVEDAQLASALAGHFERRTQRDPSLDAFYQAERQGVNPLGVEARPPTPAVAPPAAPVAAPQMPETALARLFKSPAEAAGTHYRELKALGPEEFPSKDIQRTSVNKTAGRAAQRTAQEAGVPPGPPAPITPRASALSRLMGEGSGAPAPKAQAAGPDIGGLKARYEAIQNPVARERFTQSLKPGDWQALQSALGTRPGFSSETGGIDPMLLTRLGLGAVGAATGGAMDPLGDPLMSALAGGALGALAPSLATKVAGLKPLIDTNTAVEPGMKAWASSLATPEGVMQSAKDVANTVPNLMRGNMLTSPNLLNNAVVGPWASGVHLALEKIAAGDPDGWNALRAMHPVEWAKRYTQNWGEAKNLVGEWERAGGPLLGQAGNAVEAVASVPGTLMTAGDLATRAPMSELFGEAAARRATMTGEPESELGEAIVNFQRRAGPFGQVMLPFARTLVNLTEEGLQRTPVLGSLAQSFRPTPDDMQTQAIKQLFGGGSALGGYAAGQNMDALTSLSPGDDDMEARFLRNFFSNLAGPNAVLANAGLAAGLASEAGKTPTQQVGLGIRAGIEDLPLPSTDNLTSWPGMLAAEPGNARVPSGVLPGFLRDMVNRELAGPQGAQGGRRQVGQRGQRKQRTEL